MASISSIQKISFCSTSSNNTSLLNIEYISSSHDEIELKSYFAFLPEIFLFFLSSETGMTF